jgi:hypothetical protein
MLLVASSVQGDDEDEVPIVGVAHSARDHSTACLAARQYYVTEHPVYGGDHSRETYCDDWRCKPLYAGRPRSDLGYLQQSMKESRAMEWTDRHVLKYRRS